MADFGVTQDGFVLKDFATIRAEAFARARAVFGDDVDLSETSPIRKLLEVSAAEAASTWQSLEELYYGAFASTAVGDELDLIGENAGLERRLEFAAGELEVKVVSPPQPDRSFTLPEGAVFVTSAAPVRAYYTTDTVRLTGTNAGTVAVRAFERGPGSDLAANQALAIDPLYAVLYLQMTAPTSVAAKNPQPLTGGTQPEPDGVYRERILGLPHGLWTLESVRSAVCDVDGVTDVLLFDALGGVDASQSYFNLFRFNERVFGGERALGEPYFFDIVVAHEFARPWLTESIPGLASPVRGLFEQVTEAVDRVRPLGIHPNVIEADHVEVGVRARILVEAGHDEQALLAGLKDALANSLATLKLGGDVLFSRVMHAFVEQSGVIDVQDMHLRRCPPAFGRITFGEVPLQADVIEAPSGENLRLGPREVAVFRFDSELIDIEAVPR
jgi:uncharacterized phage protein gp47/JayE